MKRGPENEELLETIRSLEKAYSKTKKRVWKALAQLLRRPRRKRVEVNLYDLDRVCGEGELALVPGKVLSLGKLSKKITVAALSASAGAKAKLAATGSKLISLKEAAEKEEAKRARIVV